MAKEQVIAEARAKALRKAACYQRLFKTPDGKIVLEDLYDTYIRTPLNVPGDSHGTHVRVGQTMVLQHIREILEVKTSE